MTTRPSASRQGTVAEALPLASLSAADLEEPGVVFTDGARRYTTTGRLLGHGGMGNAYELVRQPDGGSEPRDDAAGGRAVAKVFRREVLYQFRKDLLARRHFDDNLRVIARIQGIRHPHLLPVLVSSPIADNHLFVTPMAGESLFAVLASGLWAPRERVRLFVEALQGLGALHAEGVVHRDFTLRNVLTLPAAERGRPPTAAVFDFDLAVSPDLLPGDTRSYLDYYEGRLSGAPEFSVAPELLDGMLSREPISPRLDVYAVGTALFGLFTDDSVYGEMPDLPTLLFRVEEGIVRAGEARFEFPRDIPQALRAIILTCLERQPSARFADAAAVLRALKSAATELSKRRARGRFRITAGFARSVSSLRPAAVFAVRADPSVTRDEIVRAVETMARHGYLVERSLGRVKGHAIYLCAPDPAMVAAGRFPEENAYRKVVTVVELAGRDDAESFVETWLGRIKPALDRVRTGHLTPLHRAMHDVVDNQLLLFSEHVAEARFGTDLARFPLWIDEALALGLILGWALRRLHAEGLAHTNVCAESLVFAGRREMGTVEPMLLGLVGPSLDPAARASDVRALAALVGEFVKTARADNLPRSPALDQLRDELDRSARSAGDTPTLEDVMDRLAAGLALAHPNVAVLRAHGGDVVAFARLLVRHALYSRLFVGEAPKR